MSPPQPGRLPGLRVPPRKAPRDRRLPNALNDVSESETKFLADCADVITTLQFHFEGVPNLLGVLCEGLEREAIAEKVTDQVKSIIANDGFRAGRLANRDHYVERAGLTASAFDLLSTPAGGHGPFFTAAHVQNTTGGGSGWIAPGGASVPDGASTAILLGIALLGIEGLRRRFRIA